MPPAFDRVVVVYNPNSTGDAPARAAELVAAVRERVPDLVVDSCPTEHAGHARELARVAATATAAPLIVSVSGDGGFNEVVDGVVRAGNPRAGVAVVAAGNANDHRRVTRERPLDQAIADGSVGRLDVLRLRIGGPSAAVAGSELAGPELAGPADRVLHAHSYIGLGLSPLVAVELEKGSKGSRREIVVAIRTFWKYRPFEIVRSDGRRWRFDSLVFANITGMAKYVTLAENARPDDGVFEVVVIPHRGKVRTAVAAVRATTRGLGRAPQTTEYRFGTVKPTPLQVDGEVVDLPGGREVVVDLVPGGLPAVR